MTWSTMPLDEVIELQRGHDLPAMDRQPGSIPVIGSFGVTGYHDEARYAGPGVAIGRSGASIGTASYVASSYWPLNTCLFVRNFKGNDPRWVFRLLDSIDFSAFNSGSAQPSLNRNFLRKIPVRVPPIAEQRAIAEVSGVFDDKIAANTVIAAKAEDLAHSQFDRLSENCNRVRLSDVATMVLGGTPSRATPEFWNDGAVPWLNSGKANESRVIEPSEWITDAALAGSAAKMMPVGATILAITGATLGQVARLEIEACGNQSLVGIWGDTPSLSAWLYFAIRQEIPQLLRHATGAAQQHVNKQAVASLLVPFDEAIAADFGGLAQPLLERAAQGDRESLALARARDALLPGLMSGQISIKDAERVVEGVV